jgi:hypothetical protein
MNNVNCVEVCTIAGIQMKITSHTFAEADQ